MGLVDTSYQPWTGELHGRLRRIAAMIPVGIRLSFDGMMTRLMLFGAYSFVIVFLGFLYLVSTVRAAIPLALGNNLYREFLNSGPYGMLLMLITAVVGARLISRDIRSNATAMYFSKAITRHDYLAGKFGVIAIFLLSATFLPALLLWVGQIAMGPEEVTWAQRFGDLGAITMHSLVIVIPSSAVILAFSSLSKNGYVPGTLWILLYMGSGIVGGILESRVKGEWRHLIPWQNLTAHLGETFYAVRETKVTMPGFQRSLHPPPVMDYPWYVAAILLGAATLISLAVVLHRLHQLEQKE